MFGNTIDLQTKLNAIEADLVSAHALGDKHLHAEIFNKFASLVETPDDIEAMLDAVYEEANPPKIAAGGFGSFGQTQQQPAGLSPDLMKLLSMGIMLAGPVMAAAKFLGSKSEHDNALAAVQMKCPQLFQQNPQRATALFEAVYSTAPNIGKSPIIMSDILTQLMAMPMVDMGTIARLTEMGKNVAQTNQASGPSGISKLIGGASEAAMKNQISSWQQPQKVGKQILVPAKFKTAAGIPTVFNWGSEACKTAGLTDAFTGSGTNMEQANQATMMNQQEQGNTFLPLDSVLHELLMKEMELQQREQVLQEQEQQLQQSMQAVQQIGSQYQQEAGVNPNTGTPTEDPAAAAPAQSEEAPQAPEEAAPAEQAPAADGASPGAEAPAAEEVPAEEAAPVAEEAGGGDAPPAEEAGDPEAPAAAEGSPFASDGEATMDAPVDENSAPDLEPNAGGGDSTGAAGDAPASDAGQDGEGEQSAEQDPPAAEGEGDGPAAADGTPGAETQPPGAADGNAGLPPAVDTSPAAQAAGEAGLLDAAAPMPPADEAQVQGEDPVAAPGTEPAGASMDPFSMEYSEGASPMGEPVDNAAPVPGADPIQGGESEEAQPAESEQAAGETADTDMPDEGLPPGGSDGPTSGAVPEQTGEPPMAEEEEPAGEEQEPAGEMQEETPGPNTAESVEGSVEDEAKDTALEGAGIAEGTPLEQESDQALADGLNEQGAVATPAAAAPPAPMPAPAPPAPAAAAAPPVQTPAAGGGTEIVLPLRITVKIGEADPMVAHRKSAAEMFREAMLNLPSNR